MQDFLSVISIILYFFKYNMHSCYLFAFYCLLVRTYVRTYDTFFPTLLICFFYDRMLLMFTYQKFLAEKPSNNCQHIF